MKKIMMIGKIGSGKTSLCQYLHEEKVSYKKTQSVEVIGSAIDTPGEYLESRGFYKALLSTSIEADCVVLLQDCTDTQCRFAPGIASMFQKSVIGVISKIDLADEQMIRNGKKALQLAGVDKIFCISCYTGEGIAEFQKYCC